MVQRTTGTDQQNIEPVLSGEEVATAIQFVRTLPVAEHVAQFAIRLARWTRPDSDHPDYIQQHVKWGAGPRASQYLVLGAKAHALIQGRIAVEFEDVLAVAHPVLRHRVRLNYAAQAEGITTDQMIDRLIADVTLQANQVNSSEQASEVFRSADAGSS